MIGTTRTIVMGVDPCTRCPKHPAQAHACPSHLIQLTRQAQSLA
jgi:hypothetical protein